MVRENEGIEKENQCDVQFMCSSDRVSRCIATAPKNVSVMHDETSHLSLKAPQVIVRIRPTLDVDKNHPFRPIYAHTKKTGRVMVSSAEEDDRERLQFFDFDNVLDQESTNDDVWKTVGMQALGHFLGGTDSVIFSFGPTGSGKTWTMQGNSAPGMEGLCERAFEKVTSALASGWGADGWVCRCSAIEVYNDACIDLLAGKAAGACLSLRAEPTCVQVSSEEEMAAWTLQSKLDKLLSTARKRLHFAATSSNSHSSRSHLVLSISVSVKSNVDLWRTSRLSLVDLAGSERVAKSEVQGKTFREATHVNRSLLALGAVLSALAKKSEHVPYRSSRLTWLLKDALQPAAAICIIGHINPTRAQLRESLSTLNFLSFARTIKTRPKVNSFLAVPASAFRRRRSRAVGATARGYVCTDSSGGAMCKRVASPRGSWAAAAEALSASKGFKHCARVLHSAGMGPVCPVDC